MEYWFSLVQMNREEVQNAMRAAARQSSPAEATRHFTVAAADHRCDESCDASGCADALREERAAVLAEMGEAWAGTEQLRASKLRVKSWRRVIDHTPHADP